MCLSIKTLLCACIAIIYFNISYGQGKVYSQQEVDSFSIRPLTAEKLAEFKTMLNSNDALVGWVRYNSLKAYFYLSKNPNQDSTIYYADKAVKFFKQNQPDNSLEEKSLLNAHFALARTYLDIKNYEASLANAQAFLEVEKKYPTPIRGYGVSLVAANHLALGNDSLSLSYYKTNARDTIYMKSSRSRITTLTRIGVLYTKDYLSIPDSAKTYFKRALKETKGSSYKNSLSVILGNLGDLFKIEGSKDSAVYYYSKAYEAQKEYEPLQKNAANETKLFNDVNYGYVLLHKGKLVDAKRLLEKTLDTILISSQEDKNVRDLFLSATENLQMVYEREGNYQKATALLEKKIKILDSFNNKLLNQKLDELEVSFQTKQKEQEIKTLTIEKERAQLVSQRRLFILIGSVLLFVVSLIMAYILFNNKRLKDKYKKVSLEQQLLRTQMTPHFLFNALNNVTVLHKKHPEKLSPFVMRLSKLLRLSLDNSRAEFVVLEQEIEALENYLAIQASMHKGLTYDIHIEDHLETDMLFVPPMLIQPIVENAILHGLLKKPDLGKVTVHLHLEGTDDNTNLVCSVIDDGIGISVSKSKNSLIKGHKSVSTQVVNDRLKTYGKMLKKSFVLHAEDVVVNGEVMGTKATVELPHYFL